MPLMEAKEYDLVHGATEVIMQHKTLIAALDAYSAKRQTVNQVMGANVVEKDSVLIADIAGADLARMRALATELESLIQAIRRRLPELEKKATSVTLGIGPAMRTYFNDPTFPQLGLIDEDDG